MAVNDINERKVIPGKCMGRNGVRRFIANNLSLISLDRCIGMNISLVLRDSQRLIPNTNISGGASAISATARILGLGIGAIIGDLASELTTVEAIITSSVGVPQCKFSACK